MSDDFIEFFEGVVKGGDAYGKLRIFFNDYKKLQTKNQKLKKLVEICINWADTATENKMALMNIHKLADFANFARQTLKEVEGK